MRNSSKIWCEATDISVEEISRRAEVEVQNGGFPTLAFISFDLYGKLHNDIGASMRYNSGQPSLGCSVLSIRTTVGDLNIKPVYRLKNFLLVARNEDFEEMKNQGFDPMFWNDKERQRIDKAFEDMIILEGAKDEA